MAQVLLVLPYLESWGRRRAEPTPDPQRLPDGLGFTEQVRDFLISWVRNEFDLVVPP